MTTIATEGEFRQALNLLKSPKVLELGTKQSLVGRPTHHAEWLPPGSTHIMSDIDSGMDVDVVSDAHDLKEFADNEFDVFIAISTWEHLRKPWIAADTAARVLKPGGLLYVATHQTFPIHGYPSDYCRWTDEGLKALFDKPLWSYHSAGYAFPCTIIPPAEITVWNTLAPSFLNVDVFAIKA